MKRAFTLVEVVVSIAIFAIIAIYMYQAVSTAKNSNDMYIKRWNGDQKEQKVIKLFYNDIFSKKEIYATANIAKNGDFDIFSIRTRNSIHAMISPYVTYFVNKDSLYRIESRIPAKIPLTYEDIESVKIDKILGNVTLFRVYENKNSYLISYKSEDKLTSFQISLPSQQNSNQTQNGSR